MKAIIVTEENKEANPKHLSNSVVGDIKTFGELPNSWNNKSNYNPTEEGFYDYTPPVKTAQELYDGLVIEGNQVFDEFRKMLSEAASPYTILGNVPNELKVLTQTMLDAKERVNTGLDYLLSIDDVATLSIFSFQNEESNQLREAIESFK